jgi:hypothetical protein
MPSQLAMAGTAITSASGIGFDIVTGGHSYSGGATSAFGTSAEAVPVGPPRKSLARRACPQRGDWNCDWPKNEERPLARVHLTVSVDTDGNPTEVTVLDATTPAFAEMTRACAMKQGYWTARNEQGQVVAAITPPFGVLFHR